MPYIGNSSKSLVSATDISINDDLSVGDDASIAGLLQVSSSATTGDINVGAGVGSYATIQMTPSGTSTGNKINFGDSSDNDYSSITSFGSGAGESGRVRFISGTKESLNLYSTGYAYFSADVAGNYGAKFFNDGDNSNRSGILIQCGADTGSGTNYAVGINDGDGNGVGYITFSGGTTTYGAFTAHHEISLPDSDKTSGFSYGTLVEIDKIYYTQKDSTETERGIRYLVKKTQSAYSKKVLGAYCGDMLAVAETEGTYANNLHQCAVLGDGHILCNNSGGNISVGDGICTSSVEGIGQKADQLTMIMGISQKDITFNGSETVLVPVQFGLQQFTPWE